MTKTQTPRSWRLSLLGLVVCMGVGSMAVASDCATSRVAGQGYDSDLASDVHRGDAATAREAMLVGCASDAEPDAVGNRPAALNAGNWSTELAVSDGNAGFYSVLGFDRDGNANIAYSDFSSGKVMFARRSGSTTPPSWATEPVDSGAETGLSMAYDSFGNPAVAYSSGTTLKYAAYNGQSWIVEQVDTRLENDNVSLAFDSQNDAWIAYRVSGKRGKRDLKVAHRIGKDNWSTNVIEPQSAARYHTLVFDPDGNPTMAASGDADGDNTLDTLRFGHDDGGGWLFDTVETGIDGYGVRAGLAYDSQGNPVMVHCGGEVRLVRNDGTSWQTGELIGIGLDCSLAIDAQDTAHVGYQMIYGPPGTDEILMADRLPSGDYSINVVDVGWWGGWNVHTAIAPDDYPAVSYYQYADDDLYYAHGGPGCTSAAECEDNNECTTDVCNAGACENTPVSCADACLSCDPATGQCFLPVNCDDGDSCTVDQCVSPTGCTHTWPACGLPDGCCGPLPDCQSDPDCACLPLGDPCQTHGDCCSRWCKSVKGRKICTQ